MPKLEIHYGRVLLLLSAVILFLLRHHHGWLLAYTLVVMAGMVFALFGLPRLLDRQEQRLSQAGIKLLARGAYAEAEALLKRQWLLKRAGRVKAIAELAALLANAQGVPEQALGHWKAALTAAPPEEQTRLKLNLAACERTLKLYPAALAHYREVLKAHPGLAHAEEGLARTLREAGLPADA